MLHNESVNIWSHLIGAILVIVLVVYTIIFIKSHRDDIFNLNKLNYEIRETAKPIIDMIPNLHNLTY